MNITIAPQCPSLAGLQHAPASNCMGGHLTVPHEQKTQQSPGLGLIKVPQPVQSQKN